MHLVMWIQEWSARNTYISNGESQVFPIRDSQAIAEIRKIFSQVRFLCMKYQEWDPATQINTYIGFLTGQRELDTISTLKNLEFLSDILAKSLGIKHKFRDRVEDTMEWDAEFKKKLEFPELTAEEKEYYGTIERKWKKLCWLLTYYVVRCKGDAHILLSGPNLAGKSNTAIRLLKQCNTYLVDYWKVKKYNEFYIEKHPDAAETIQDKFQIKRDVYITPDAQLLKDRFESGQYQCIDINEGMEAATNLQSMKSDIVSLGVKRFTSRSYHNIVVWEYQVQQRPTAMMLEGMNFWIQKMKKRHFILSIASTLVRKKDPYYMKELDKCRTDRDIGVWMKKINPNYNGTFRAPKLNARDEHEFQMYYWEQKDVAAKASEVRRKSTQGYDLMLQDVWTRVNIEHTLSLIEIEGLLDEIGYSKKDKEAFMRDYGRLNRLRQYEKYNKKEEMKVVG